MPVTSTTQLARPRWWPGVVAWTLWALATVAWLVIPWLDQQLRHAGRPDLTQWDLRPGVALVTAATVGAVLASRRPGHPVGQVVGQQRRPRWGRPGLPQRRGGSVGGAIQQYPGELDGGQPVGQAVVQLEDQPHPALSKFRHQPQLPQRPGPVQQPQAQLIAQPQQLPLATRRRQVDRADVVGQVKGGVIDPQRQPLPNRGGQHPLTQPGDQLQAAGELLADGVHPEAAIGVVQRPHPRRRPGWRRAGATRRAPDKGTRRPEHSDAGSGWRTGASSSHPGPIIHRPYPPWKGGLLGGNSDST